MSDPPASTTRINIGVTLAGSVLPALVALALFPLLNARLGTELFGFFMLAWASVGFSALLDLGLGRALTHFSAQHQASAAGRDHAVDASLTVLFVVAVIVCAIGFVALFVAISLGAVRRDAGFPAATALLMASMPAAILTSGIKGVIEGRRNFMAAALLRTFSGLLFIGLPAICGLAIPSPVAIAAGFLVARLVAVSAYAAYERVALQILNYRGALRPSSRGMNEVLRFSGWVSVSTLVGSAMAYMDRFSLALTSTLAQAAFYAAPFELISRLLLIPGAVVTVIFPQLSQTAGNAGAIARIVRQGYVQCLALIIPLITVMTLGAQTLLSLWMGDEFSESAGRVVEILALGIAFNAAAHIPVAALQATGRPEDPGRMHLLESLPATVLFLVLAATYGALGAALAWTIRAAADFALMAWMLRRHLRRLESRGVHV